MMLTRLLLTVALSALLLGGCAKQSTAPQPPESGTAASGSGTDGWVSSYPYGSATGATAATTTAPSATAGTTGVTVKSGTGETAPAPSGSGWYKAGITEAQHQADVEACYYYARSQVDHDMRIERDVQGARFDDDQGLGMTALTRRMDLYDHGKRRTELVSRCMENKGYARS